MGAFSTSVVVFSGMVLGGLLTWGIALAWAYRTVTAPPKKLALVSYIRKSILGPYYVSVISKIDDAQERDEHGGVLYRQSPGASAWLHPVKSAHHAFAHYERYLTDGRPEDLEEFLLVANGLVAGAVIQPDGAATWPYHSSFFAGQQVPWLSAMGQGQGIAVLCRAYEESGDLRYLKTARRALQTFEMGIADGGVRCADPRRGVFFEEYAFHEFGRQHHTLNGMMAALFGVYDLWKVTGDATARRIFDEGVSTIRDNLPAYHFPFCSSYDLRHEHGERPLFQARYNSVHVCHLRILAVMADEGYFAAVADLWDCTLRDGINRLRLASWYLGWKAADIGRAAREQGVVRAVSDNLARLISRGFR